MLVAIFVVWLPEMTGRVEFHKNRDSQEVKCTLGLEVLKIFKAHEARASLLDDFLYYESREKFTHEERAGRTTKVSGAPFFVPGLHQPPPRKLNYVFSVLAVKDDKVNSQNELKSMEGVCGPSLANQVPATIETSPSIINNPSEGKPKKDSVSTLKIGLLTISSEKSKTLYEPLLSSATAQANSELEATFTVGTMPVKIKGLKKTSVSRSSGDKHEGIRS